MRPEITKLFLERIQSLKTNVRVFAVVTTDDVDNIELCKSYMVEYITHKNSPLGSKWNAGITHALFQSDYVIIVGSDDLLSDDYFDAVLPYMEKGQAFGGITSAYVVKHGDTENALILDYNKEKILGSGCFIRSDIMRIASERVRVRYTRSISPDFKKTPSLRVPLAKHLERIGNVQIVGQSFYELWPSEENKGMDFGRDLRIAEIGYAPTVIHTETPTITCIKSGTNIWSYSQVEQKWGRKIEYSEVKHL